MKAIVTVKLQKNPQHDPFRKQVGVCPVSGLICTDVTGEHHSYIEEGAYIDEIMAKAKQKYRHVTRVEVI